jgi:iron complex transport system substrate-binding protein
VLDSIVTLGAATGRDGEAAALVSSLRDRLAAVAAEVAARTSPRPRVLLLEWTDPPYAPGHWVPQMVELAGGTVSIGQAGEKSVRVTWEAALAGRPDLVVAAPCGYDLAGSAALAEELVAAGTLPQGLPVWAVDANASWARPSGRLVDGVEALADVLGGRSPREDAARRIR